MIIGGIDFDYFITSKPRYSYLENKLLVDVQYRTKDSLINRHLTLEIPGINEHLDKAFKEEGLIDG